MKQEKKQPTVSKQALKICAMTFVCLLVMFGAALFNKNRMEGRLVSEYTITEGNPRHVLFETMPQGEAQMTVGLFLRAEGLAQYEEGEKLITPDRVENMDFEGKKKAFEEGRYIKEMTVHSFETLAPEQYQEKKEYYDGRAALLGYEEYQIIQVSFSQDLSEKAKEDTTEQSDGTHTENFAVGRRKNTWKIFEREAL